MTPTVALLTDGRGNIALDGSPDRALAEADSLRLARSLRASAIPALVIDTANRPPACPAPAGARTGRHLHRTAPGPDARKLSGILTATLGD